VHRLFGVERPLCQCMLDALVDARFLHANADGTYSRLTDGALTDAPAQSSRFKSSGSAATASS
jgi:protocatechuate 3,4-dioxygenase beta subunit